MRTALAANKVKILKFALNPKFRQTDVSGSRFILYIYTFFTAVLFMIFSTEGHHGTSIESATGILTSNYELSKGDDEWLGDGVYFFINGISSKTVDLAEKWANAQSWDNEKKILKYKEYCVIQSKIEVDKSEFLDLTTEDGVEILQYLVDRYKEKIESIGKKIKFLDGLLLNLARGEGVLPLEVVKGNFYIKFAKERIERINLSEANLIKCTFMI